MIWLNDYITVTARHTRHLLRSPLSIAFALVQPIVWLALYGQLFSRVTELSAFHGTSYISFLTPGIIAMSALFSSGWVGIGITRDLDNGVLERLLASPVRRSAILVGRLANLALTIVTQSVILLLLGVLLGARYSKSAYWSWTLVLADSILLSACIGGLSLALAAVTRKEEAVIGGVNFLLLPLAFLSPVLIEPALMPNWMRLLSKLNPVTWAVDGCRVALQGHLVFHQLAFQLCALAIATLLSITIAMWAFRDLQAAL
jgi:ABC-2 type transport system permease protein